MLRRCGVGRDRAGTPFGKIVGMIYKVDPRQHFVTSALKSKKVAFSQCEPWPQSVLQRVETQPGSQYTTPPPPPSKTACVISVRYAFCPAGVGG